jgi:predicted acyltransferase
MGVLQRIGLAYLVAGLLTFRTTVKQQVMIIVGLLYGYWLAMTVLPVPDTGAMGQLVLGNPSGTMAAWWDRLLLDWSRFGLGNHLWASSKTWDPEGIFSTIPAVGTAMLGNLAGRWIAANRPMQERLNGLFAAGALAMMLGLMWNWSFPINKSIWTSSYALFTAGMASLSIAAIMWIVDVHQVKGWTKPFVIYGMNPIFKVSYDGKTVSLQSAIYQSAFASWLPPKDASLAFALSFVLFWFAILYVLYRKKIFLKV